MRRRTATTHRWRDACRAAAATPKRRHRMLAADHARSETCGWRCATSTSCASPSSTASRRRRDPTAAGSHSCRSCSADGGGAPCRPRRPPDHVAPRPAAVGRRRIPAKGGRRRRLGGGRPRRRGWWRCGAAAPDADGLVHVSVARVGGAPPPPRKARASAAQVPPLRHRRRRRRRRHAIDDSRWAKREGICSGSTARGLDRPAGGARTRRATPIARLG